MTLKRTLVGSLLLAASSLALAQGTMSTGASFASVALSGEANLGSLVRLELSTDTLTFDLRGDTARAPLCVTSVEPDDTIAQESLFGDPYVMPAGTSFSVTTFPTVSIEGGRALGAGQLPLRSPGAAVVCYRTFTMFAFSNTDGWQVTVDRFELPNTPSIENLYLTAVCPGDSVLGMRALSGEQPVTLLRDQTAGACSEALVVAAVKVSSEAAGTSAVGLRYTLMSAGQAVGLPESAPTASD